MNRTSTVIIGGGQAGLALSRILTTRNHEHVVLERGRVAQRWTERWDSLRLLTPNWMSRLPGWSYQGPDPDGFMGRSEVVQYLRDFAESFEAPVVEEATVLKVDNRKGLWRVVTTRGDWSAENMVIATGHCAHANVPGFANRAPGDLEQVTSIDYRNPGELGPGGVLVVGASATGIQLADEIRHTGRRVVMAVGRHTRLPRVYRGRDIMYWLDRLGALDRPISDMADRKAAMHEPSLQLVGRDSKETLDLAKLQQRGVELTGRLLGLENRRARFAGDLGQNIVKAEMQLEHILERIDQHIASHDLDGKLPARQRLAGVSVPPKRCQIDLRRAGIDTVLWATGYKRRYPWLKAPVLDSTGEIRHRRGRTEAPGLYVLGLQFMIRRRSSFIDGVGRDAEEIAGHITGGWGRQAVA